MTIDNKSKAKISNTNSTTNKESNASYTGKHKEKLHQQQILFNESDIVVEGNKKFCKSEEATNPVTNRVTKQVVFDNDDYLPVLLDENGFDEIRKTELNSEQLNQEANAVKGGKRSWLWRIITTLLITLVTIEAVDFFITGFEQSPIIASLYALLLASLTLVSGNYLWREFIGLRQFKKRQQTKQQAIELLLIDGSIDSKIDINTGKDTKHFTSQSTKRARDFCDNISHNLPCDLAFDHPKEQQIWHEALTTEHNASELVELYSRVVLSKVDEKALNEVAKFSTEAVVLVALSPVALIDMLIMLSRNLRMINKIAGLYGLKLGYWSRIKLIKQVFVNMAYAGASELIADFGSDMLGAELLGKLSSRFAQGLGAGMLTARLGAKTMELCRPIPFKEKPKLTDVRKKIAQQIKALVSPSK